VGRIGSYIGLALLLVAIESFYLVQHTGYWVWLVRIALLVAYAMFGWWREKPFKSVT
jgi:hypothetical protein